MPPPTQSDIWNYFKINELDKDKADCNLCNKIYSRKGRSTSSLKNHLKSMHPEMYSIFESLCKEKQKLAMIEAVQFPIIEPDRSEIARKRWKNLKDNYTRYLRQKRNSKWIWADHMAPFQGFFPHRRKYPTDKPSVYDLTYETDESNNVEEGEFIPEPIVDISEPGENQNHDPPPGEGIPENPLRENEEKSENEQPELPLLPALSRFIAMQKTAPELDEVDHLFSSFAQTMKKFSPLRQARIKQKLFEIFGNEEISHYEEKLGQVSRNQNSVIETQQSKSVKLPAKTHKCNKCDKIFSNVASLRVHKRNHLKKGPYKCKDCDKIFMGFSNLYAHSKTHKIGPIVTEINGNYQQKPRSEEETNGVELSLKFEEEIHSDQQEMS